MANFLGKIFGDGNDKALKPFLALVPDINALEPGMAALSDADLRAKTAEFKERLSTGGKTGKVETEEDILPEAFAVVREAAKRTLKQRHFDVQLVGGAILHKSGIAEMRTGEGKTLVATLPAYLNALTGHGVHVVTVNDYLSRRDAAWMGQIYDFLGLTVAVINHQASYLYDKTHIAPETAAKDEETAAFKVAHDFLRPCARKEAYAADITYGTNQEFGFDYLRDNLEYDPNNLRQREWNYAIVDEVDSILIDEARTPLIISAATAESEDLYKLFAKIAGTLADGQDFEVDEKRRAITLTDAGITKAEKALGVDNIYTDRGVKYVHHLETAVRAKALYHKDKEYVVRNNEIVIVDEFTGRLQPGRRWSEGLHQAIEAKEGVAIQKETRTYASITYQNFFRLYKKLSGMTGTALTSREEFFKVYELDTIAVPTNRPVARADLNDLIFQTEPGKLKAIARKVKELNQKGQPVLIGTVSIEKNEMLSDYLRREGVRHEMLNAKNHEREGEIIAQAGRHGAVTIATNMAGRGVDIKLGGALASPEEYEKVKAVGGLFVLGTERHEARRIDNQLRGRAGRQGDPGATQFFVSLEDNLMRVFATDMVKKMMGRFGIPEDEPIENRMITRSLETAQSRIEGFNFDARKQVLEYDDVMNIHRKTVYDRRRALLLGPDEDVEKEVRAVAPADVIEAKKKELGDQMFIRAVRHLFLQTIDMFWVDHLEAMEYLRNSVNLRAYGQRDPLIEYRREGLGLFKSMQAAIDAQVASLVPGIGAPAAAPAAPVIPAGITVDMKLAGRAAGHDRGRNDKVVITRGGEKKEVKYKKLDAYLKDGWTLES
ncbi:MAG: preprotein translocase subunit SecA [Patescibacteria group bacterium]|nr:preprotein translocase subunit SecA [Patescibacteria group bacterium]MDE2116379.1 preprotein translocase subunit SecA [Patescibacteria group bacterium]